MLKQRRREPPSDVAVVQTGTGANVLAALESRQIPAATLTPPQSFVARRLGSREFTNTYDPRC